MFFFFDNLINCMFEFCFLYCWIFDYTISSIRMYLFRMWGDGKIPLIEDF